MLVDTCHSGNTFNARLIKDAADASIAVFAATDDETLAQEPPALGHRRVHLCRDRGVEGWR